MNIFKKVVDKVSDVIAAPSVRASRESQQESTRNYQILKNRSAGDKKNFKYSIEQPHNELIATPRSFGPHLDSHVQAHKKIQISQRDLYAKAMNGAQRKGGSNGVGVGY